MPCFYCKAEGGAVHDELGGCPNIFQEGTTARHNALAEWNAGYKAGRSGKELDAHTSSYGMGWCRGVVALEEAENGYDPRFDQ